MDRRNFFKIVSATSAGALGGCGKKTDKLIPLLVPEHEIVPGEEQWHPAVCGECGAGCGTLVRIMAGVRTVERNGEPFRERVAAIKKIEGNPLDPISGGRLCARGQASVQSLYHPDRLRGPMRRTGRRGQAQFAAVSWEEAIGQAAETISKARAADPARIVFLERAAGGDALARDPTIHAGARCARSGGLLDFRSRRRTQSRGDGLRMEGPAGLRSGSRALCAGRRRGLPGRLGFAGLLRTAIRRFPPGPPQHPRTARAGRVASLDYGGGRRPVAAATARLGAAVSGRGRTHAARCRAGTESRGASEDGRRRISSGRCRCAARDVRARREARPADRPGAGRVGGSASARRSFGGPHQFAGRDRGVPLHQPDAGRRRQARRHPGSRGRRGSSRSIGIWWKRWAARGWCSSTARTRSTLCRVPPVWRTPWRAPNW